MVRIPQAPIHPDDVLFFHEVRAAMVKVAKKYNLPLTSITPMKMPESGMIDRMGDCSASGNIRIVLRCTVNGEWCPAPLSPHHVWDTAAHELAHLKHMNHGEAFKTFAMELMNAIENEMTDHRDKVIKRLLKMQATRDSEAKIGNAAAAESFAAAINKMLLDHELSPTDLDVARATDDDPVIEVPCDLTLYRIPSKSQRIAWQETLARVVAKANLCTFLISSGSNRIWFVGTKSHAVMAEYTYGTLVPVAEALCDGAYRDYCRELKGEWDAMGKRKGFKEAWMLAFIKRIEERFDEAREAAVAEADARDAVSPSPDPAPGMEPSTSTGLMRLAGAMKKVDKYIDDKFTPKKGRRRHAKSLNGLRSYNSAGRERGRAAADKMAIGRRGITASPRLLN